MRPLTLRNHNALKMHINLILVWNVLYFMTVSMLVFTYKMHHGTTKGYWTWYHSNTRVFLAILLKNMVNKFQCHSLYQITMVLWKYHGTTIYYHHYTLVLPQYFLQDLCHYLWHIWYSIKQVISIRERLYQKA